MQVFVAIIQFQNSVMDLKTQRYMQRIEQIMQMPKRGTPYRPSKSPITCKANHLDTYLKYELSSKIIQKIFDRYNQMLVQQFFNIIRITQYRQKEKIYRFIAVEKAEHTREMWVDGTIVCKMLSAILKEIIKKRYTEFVNLLQLPLHSNDKTPQKCQMNRNHSARESNSNLSPVSARMRAFTNVSKLQKSSQHNQSQIDLFQLQRSQVKINNFAVRNFASIVNMNIRSFKHVFFQRIRMFYVQEQMNNKQNEKQTSKNLEKDTIKLKQQKSMNKYRSIILIINLLEKSVSQTFVKLKKYNLIKSKQLQKISRFAQATFQIFQNQSLRLFHTFLTHIRTAKFPEKSGQQNQSLLQVLFRSKQKSAISNKAKSYNTDYSNVQPYNASANLIFFSMVNKVIKLMMAISKLLIPYKEAFIKIDHYASYSYRIEQSLKSIPQRTLKDAFLVIKHYAFSPKTTQQKKQVEKDKVIRFNEMLYGLIKPHIIEGFTHIKIISKERDLKIKIHPAKQNIVQMAKKFILDRGQYTNQSYFLLQELKTAIISGNSSQTSRKPKSSIR